MGHIESPSSNISSPSIEFQQPIYGKFNNVATTSNRDRNEQKQKSKDINSGIYGQRKDNDEFIGTMNGGLTSASRIGNRRQQNYSVAGVFRNLRQICSTFWRQLITICFGQHCCHHITSNILNITKCWHPPRIRALTLLAPFLFLLLEICISAFGLAHFLRLPPSSNSSPSAYFLLALLSVLLIASTFSALLAIFRPSQNGTSASAVLRLRPLLFLTFLFPLLGLPLLLLPLPYCFYLAPTFRLQCSNRPFLMVSLALLIASLLLLRPLLQYWLAKLRLAVCLHHLKGHPLEVATHFNTFLARMEATTIEDEQWELATLIAQWKEGFGQQLQRALEEAESTELTAKYGQMGMKKLEIDIDLDEEDEKWKDEGNNGRKGRKRRRKNGKRKSILMKRNEGAKISNAQNSFNALEGQRRVQFSQLLLLREISSVQNEIGQLVRMDQHQKFVLESLYADFVRDFRLKMDSVGHLRTNSVHQIFTRFGPVETMHYTKMTSKEGGKGMEEQIYGNLVEGKNGGAENGHQKIVATGIRIKGAMKGKRKGGDRKDKDYATIDSAGEATNDLMRRAVAKCLGQSTSTTRPQLQPQVPSTPIPQTTPTDPQGPMDGTGRGVQPLLITLYENFAARMGQQPQNHRMEEVKEEEDASKEMEEEIEVKIEEKATEMVNEETRLEIEEERDEEEEQKIIRSHLGEKPKQKTKGKGKCNCPLGEDCMMVTNSRAKAQYYYLKPGKNGRTYEVMDERINIERDETDEDDDGDVEHEDEEEESLYFTRK